MRKTIVIVAAVLILAFAMASVALADGGPHGGYTATTDACAGCHRAHTATGPALLKDDSTYDLCWSCHSNTGQGANTDVEYGIYLSSRDDSVADEDHGATLTGDNAPLLGGGFAQYGGLATTSSHVVDPATASANAWGNGVNRGLTGALTAGAIDCASCHDPHGSANYRIMNVEINGNPVAMQLVDEGDANKDYDTEQWGTGASTVCAACHGAYHVTSAGSGSDVAMETTGGYTHRVDMAYNHGGNANPETVGKDGFLLPLAESTTNDLVVCQTCHLPHGTSAAMTGNADNGGLPGETAATDSALLRLDNRGVCEVCHQK